jgi:hypothetical protein
MVEQMYKAQGNGCDGGVLVAYTIGSESERYSDNSADNYKNTMAMVENMLKPYKIICTYG